MTDLVNTRTADAGSQAAGRRSGAIRGRVRSTLPRPARKAVLSVHVISSVGWLGVAVGMLTLAITGVTTKEPQTQHAAYRVLGLFGDVVLLPISLTALLTGVVLSLGTRWGLVRYYWVLVKFVLTVGAITATIFALRPLLDEALAVVSATPASELVAMGETGADLLAASSVSLTIYVTCTILSTVKPWGRTRFGRRRTPMARDVRSRY